MRRLWPDELDDVDVDAVIAAEERPTPAGRPWLLVNMISSLDGAITVEGRSGKLGGPADRAVFLALRAVADVVMAGAGTVRAEGYGPVRLSPEQRAGRAERGQVEVPPIAIVTRSLDLDLTSRLFTDADAPRPVVLTCGSAPTDRRAATEAVADVVVAGDDTVDLPAAFAVLAERGAAVVTCEGGPRLNGDLVADDLIDEWALTLSPLLTAGESARGAVGPTPPEPRRLVLDRLLEGDGLLLARWLRLRS